MSAVFDHEQYDELKNARRAAKYWREQAEDASPIKPRKLQRGDLVFFSTAGPGASHVGIATGRTTAVSATARSKPRFDEKCE